MTGQPHRAPKQIARHTRQLPGLTEFQNSLEDIAGSTAFLGPPLSTLLIQVVVQSALSGVVAVFAYTRVAEFLGTARAAVFPALVPAAAILIGIPVTEEFPAVTQWLGLGVVSAGLLIAVGVIKIGRT